MRRAALEAGTTVEGSPGIGRLWRVCSEGLLVRLTRLGHAGAFAALAARHRPRMVAFSWYMLGSEEHARTAVRDALVDARAEIAASGRGSEPRTMLFRLAYARCRALTPDTAGAPCLVPGLDELPETERAALLLRDAARLSFEEIAELLTTRPEEAQVLVVKARVALVEHRLARRSA